MAVHELVDHDAVAAVTSAGNRRNEAVARVRLTTMSEGRCAQLLHVGPLSAMPMTIDRLHEFISDQDFVLAPQPHHELYLSDSSRVDADRWRTVIRQPVASSIS
jgi:hypothetical protein